MHGRPPQSSGSIVTRVTGEDIDSSLARVDDEAGDGSRLPPDAAGTVGAVRRASSRRSPPHGIREHAEAKLSGSTMSAAPSEPTPGAHGAPGGVPTPATSIEVDVEPRAGTTSPYKNLFVPLVVVPALIVGAIVLVFVFFGAISGSEATLGENLDRVISGGAGDHTQAAFNMARQIAENQEARRKGEPVPWPIDADFLPRLRKAWDSSSADEPRIRLVLAMALAQLGDESGVDRLVEMLTLSDAQDPDGAIRFHVLASLGAIGDPRATAAVRRVLEESPDDGLRSVAAIALQGIGDDAGGARDALLGALDDPSFEVRANAALGLAARGDPAGARVLRALLDRDAYADEHERDARKFSKARQVSASRVAAIEALARLAVPEDRAAIARVAEEEDDLAVREAAMKALEAWRN